MRLQITGVAAIGKSCLSEDWAATRTNPKGGRPIRPTALGCAPIRVGALVPLAADAEPGSPYASQQVRSRATMPLASQ